MRKLFAKAQDRVSCETHAFGAAAALCGALARDARAGTLLLTHLNPLYDPQALLAEAREAYPAAELAVAGARYRV